MAQRVKIATRWGSPPLSASMAGSGVVTLDMVSWNLPATLNVQQSGNIPLRQYAVNATGWTISVSNLPTGVTYNVGTEELEGASTGTASGTATFTLSLSGQPDVVDTATVALVEVGSPLFFDDFDYQADESNITSGSNPFVTIGGWNAMRSQDNDPWTLEDEGKLNGTIRTVTKAQFDTNTGTSAPWPESASSYALRMAANSVPGGTDFYLQLGGTGNTDFIPANVYFQFWIYMNRNPATNEVTAIESRHKFLYPTNQFDGKWMFHFATDSYMTTDGSQVFDELSPEGRPLSDGGAHFVDRDGTDRFGTYHVKRYTGAGYGSGDWGNFGANLGPTGSRYIKANTWTLMRIHYDTSNNSSGVFEVWLRELNQPWLKVAEWIGGTSPDSGLEWYGFNDDGLGGAGGHERLKVMTTVGWTQRDDGVYYYLRDFTMAEAPEDLPSYPDEGS